jgi:hypothetical protein
MRRQMQLCYPVASSELLALRAKTRAVAASGMARFPHACGPNQRRTSMGARCINGRKKAKRRAHKKTRAKQLAASLAQNAAARAVPRRAADNKQ